MKGRRLDYDLMRVCFMFGVIYLHVAAATLRDLTRPLLWNFSNVLVCLFTPAVPLFFMMSGSLLLRSDRTLDLDLLLRRRVPKLLVPLLTYSALVILFLYVDGDAPGATTALSRLLNTPATVPYWFLYALIPLYLISPFLRYMVRDMTEAHWRWMMALWGFTMVLSTLRLLVPFDVQTILTEHWTLNLRFVGGYLGYFLLGAWLDRWEKLPPAGVLAAGTLGLLLFVILCTRWDTFYLGYYSSRFTDYQSLFTLVLASLLFLLSKSLFGGRTTQGKLLPLLAGNSFPVYLLHPLAIGGMQKLWHPLTGKYMIATPGDQLLFFGLVSLSCVLCAVLLSSLPGVCFLFTGQNFASASNLQSLFGKKAP